MLKQIQATASLIFANTGGAPIAQSFNTPQKADQPRFFQNEVSPKNESGYGMAVAGKSSAATASGCSCGSCPVCVARAYAVNAEKTAPKNAISVDQDKNTNKEYITSDQGDSTKAVDEKQEQTKPISAAPKGTDGDPLDTAEQVELIQLKKIDQEVRAHERAHLAAAGPYAKGAANFQYEQGPDGRKYAVAGEVRIDTSKEAKPEQTITKMNIVRRAALAPVNPSPQDRRVAASASSKIQQARVELQSIRARVLEKSIEDIAAENVYDKTEKINAEENQTGGQGEVDFSKPEAAPQKRSGLSPLPIQSGPKSGLTISIRV